jgi:hypothetical protein
MITKTWAWRIAAIAVAAMLIPACSKGIQAAGFLMLEGFGVFPGTNWTGPSTTNGATAALGGVGSPAPALEMGVGTTLPSTASTTTTLAFNNPNVTISVHMASLALAAGDTGVGTISILDSTPAVIATASWNTTSDLLTLHINLGTADVTVPLTADGTTFHRIVFNVDSAGTASWSVDNAAPVVTRALFPAGMLKVQLDAAWTTGTTFAVFRFDNVNVTSP